MKSNFQFLSFFIADALLSHTSASFLKQQQQQQQQQQHQQTQEQGQEQQAEIAVIKTLSLICDLHVLIRGITLLWGRQVSIAIITVTGDMCPKIQRWNWRWKLFHLLPHLRSTFLFT